MKNIVGQTPRGKDYYPREAITNRIYRRLDSGNHLYLSAPRRSGKTSIMRALEDNPKEGYIFIYLNVEDCNDPEDYFRLLAEELERMTTQDRLAKLGKKAEGTLRQFLERVKNVKISILEVELNGSAAKPSYAEVFEELLRDLESDDQTIVIMVDEFPVAVENIAKAKGNAVAAHFLHANRGLRQRAKSSIRFIYTGSIGLPIVARKLDPAPTINDLNIVEIPPLTVDEGLDMSRQIFGAYSIEVDEPVLRYMLDQIEWLMPFFIQLVIQLLIDEMESEKTATISTAMVDNVLKKAANHRNNVYFASYLDRLAKTLPGDQCDTAKAILAKIAAEGFAERKDFTQANAQLVLETLEYDGYIHQQGGQLRFNSPILRMWWKKNA